MAYIWFFLGIAAVVWGLRRIKRFSLETPGNRCSAPAAHDAERS